MNLKDTKDLDREKRNNKIRENLNQIIEKQKGNSLGKSLADNLASLVGVESRREALLESFIDKKEVWEAYKEAIVDSGYYLFHARTRACSSSLRKTSCRLC